MKLPSIIILAGLLFSLNACSPSETPEATEPGGPIAALMGNPIPPAMKHQAGSLIFGALTDLYKQQHDIKATPEEIDQFLNSSVFKEMDDRNTSALQDQQMAVGFIVSWKVNKALYDQYGGRISMQQFGPEPIDGYLGLIADHKKQGTFVFYDPAVEADFMNFFTNQSVAHTITESQEEADKMMSAPFWVNFRSTKPSP